MRNKTINNEKRNRSKIARLEIVGKLYKRGYSYAKIKKEVMDILNLETYSTKTVHSDVHTLLKEWRENRLQDMDMALQLELERIDETINELWDQWEKSKTDYTKIKKKQTAAAKKDKEQGEVSVRPYQMEEERAEIVSLGNPQYIAEIRQQLSERRKLLGLYAPEKKDINGDFSFSTFLMESGMLDDTEQQ